MYFKTKMLLNKLISEISSYYIEKIDGNNIIELEKITHFYNMLAKICSHDDQITEKEDNDYFFKVYLKDDYENKKLEDLIDSSDNKENNK